MSQKLLFRPDEAAHVLGSRVLLENMVRADWIKPVLQRNKLTLYSYSDLCKCARRIEEGEVPQPK